jgi:hypothetical protein
VDSVPLADGAIRDLPLWTAVHNQLLLDAFSSVLSVPPLHRKPRRQRRRSSRFRLQRIRGSAQNIIKGWSVLLFTFLFGYSPIMRTYVRWPSCPRRHRGLRLTKIRSMLDPSIGARPPSSVLDNLLESAGTPCGGRRHWPLVWVPPTNGPRQSSDPVKSKSLSPLTFGGSFVLLCYSARSHTCELPSSDSSAALTASRRRRPSRQCHHRSRARDWPGTYQIRALICPLGPDSPGLDSSACRPTAPSWGRCALQAFAFRRLLRAGAKSVHWQARPLQGGASLLPGTLSFPPPLAVGTSSCGTPHSRQPSDSAPSLAASLTASRIHPGPRARRGQHRARP